VKTLFGSLFIIAFLFSSCSNTDENISITLKFTQNWNAEPVTNQDFNEFKFTTENGTKVSVERLRYLVSNISIIGDTNHSLIDVGENSETLLTINNLTPGSYKLKFVFGFQDADNTDGIYQDLNTASFNVPGMLGGGYHYMQFDGKYKNSSNQDSNFNYHTIRAVDRTNPANLILEDTSFEVDLGTVIITNNAEIEIKMNIAEWFKNPNTWDLNELNTVLMPNFEAQKMMSENGRSVFSLGDINQ
tara:strand:+ start:5179 stop:5913 length:735 start_codon:yes stop_codon:yes gene_type:complete